jgi:hypothetical protein
MRELRTIPVYADTDHAVYVVASVTIRETRGRDYAGWYASAAPVALVVIDAEGARATDLEDNALDPAPLLADVPSLAAIWPSD